MRGYPACSFPKLLERLLWKIVPFYRMSPIDKSDIVTLREVMVFLLQQHVHLGVCALI